MDFIGIIFTILSATIVQSSVDLLIKKLNLPESDVFQVSCIANEQNRYSAISLNVLQNGALPRINRVTEIKNNRKFDFGYNTKSTGWNRNCNRQWIITDERWEKFPNLFLDHRYRMFQHKGYQLGFSVRGTGTVKIVWRIEPYAFITTISKNNIEIEITNIVSQEKWDISDEMNIDVTEDIWRTFQLIHNPNNGSFSIFDVDSKKISASIEFDYQRISFKPDQMIYLINESMEFKLHEVDATETAISNAIQIFQLDKSKEYMCLSLYISMCPKCSISITLISDDLCISKYYITTGLRDTTWIHEIIHFNITSLPISKMKFESLADENVINPFWVISDIEECNREATLKGFDTTLKHYSIDDKNTINCQVIGNISSTEWLYEQPHKKTELIRATRSNMISRKVFVHRRSVMDLTVDKAGSTYICIRWNGENNLSSNYTIIYWVNKYQACETNEFPSRKMIKVVNSNTYNLTKLSPYSEYIINVRTIGSGTIDEQIVVNTAESDDADLYNNYKNNLKLRKGYPVKVDNVSAILYPNLEKCSLVKSSLLFKIQIGEIVFFRNGPSITVTSLQPYTNYVVTIKVVNPKNYENLSNTLIYSLKTAHSTISNTDIYLKVNHILRLRWKTHYLSTGKLTRYSIVSRCNLRKTISTLGITCPLWPDYTCVDVPNLTNCTMHNFNISISSKIVSMNSISKVAIILENSTGSPALSAPELFQADWLLETKQLNISWSHPFFSNSDLKKMELKVFEKKTLYLQLVDSYIYPLHNQNYSAHYWMLVDNLQCASFYIIKLIVLNEHSKTETSLEVITPPDIPRFEQSPTFVKNSETNTSIKITLPVLETCFQCEALVIVTVETDPYLIEFSGLEKYKNILEHENISFNRSWLAAVIQLEGYEPVSFTIGDYSDKSSTNYELPLSNTDVSIILLDTYYNKSASNYYNLGRRPIPSRNVNFICYVVLCVLIIAVLLLVYIGYKKFKAKLAVLTYDDICVPQVHPMYLEVLPEPPRGN